MPLTTTQFLSGFTGLRELLSTGVKFFPLAKAPETVRRECAHSENQAASKTGVGAKFAIIFPPGHTFDVNFRQRFAMFSPALYFIAEPGAQVNLYETHQATSPTGEATARVIVKARSRFIYSFSQNAILSKTLEYAARVEAGATFDFTGFFHGTNEHSVRVAAHLRGQKSVSNIRLALLCSRHSRTELALRHTHASSRTSGQILLKAAVRDQSVLRADGWITVGPKAQKTNSFLREDVLLLSPEASAQAVPNLEILHHDVRASHSATVGQLSPQQLYYCAARGLSATQSTRLLTKGFFADLAGQTKNREQAQRYHKSLTKFL